MPDAKLQLKNLAVYTSVCYSKANKYSHLCLDLRLKWDCTATIVLNKTWNQWVWLVRML